MGQNRNGCRKLPFRQYRVKIAGSGRIVLCNHRFIKEITLSTNYSINLSPLHNHPEIQNNPDMQSEYTSSEMDIPNEPQNEPNIVYHDTPLSKLSRALQRLANYNKPGLKE